MRRKKKCQVWIPRLGYQNHEQYHGPTAFVLLEIFLSFSQMSLIFTFLFFFLKPSGVTQNLPSNTPYLQCCERRGNHCSGFGVVYVLVPDGTHTLSTREYLFSASCFASPEEKLLLRFFSSGDLSLVFQPLSRPESRSFSKVAFLSFLFPQGTEGLCATSVFQ